MAQRSGMPPHALDLLVVLGFDRDYIRHALRYVRPTSSFRSEFAYQNSLFLVTAELVETHTGKSLEENNTTAKPGFIGKTFLTRSCGTMAAPPDVKP